MRDSARVSSGFVFHRLGCPTKSDQTEGFQEGHLLASTSAYCLFSFLRLSPSTRYLQQSARSTNYLCLEKVVPHILDLLLKLLRFEKIIFHCQI